MDQPVVSLKYRAQDPPRLRSGQALAPLESAGHRDDAP